MGVVSESRLMTTLRENRGVVEAMVRMNLVGRYRNSRIGLAWNFIMPVLLIAAVYLTFVSIKSIHLEEDYWIYLASGMFMMTVCMSCLRGRTFFHNSNYVKKMAVPKWLVVMSDVLSQFIVLLTSYAVLIALVLLTGHALDITALLTLPLTLIVLFFMCLGLSFLLSTLSVVFYDVGYLMSVVSRVAIWLTPVFFYMSEVNDMLRTVALCNPFTYPVEMVHAVFCGGCPSLALIGASVLIATGIFCLGWLVFNRYKDMIPELI